MTPAEVQAMADRTEGWVVGLERLCSEPCVASECEAVYVYQSSRLKPSHCSKGGGAGNCSSKRQGLKE